MLDTYDTATALRAAAGDRLEANFAAYVDGAIAAGEWTVALISLIEHADRNHYPIPGTLIGDVRQHLADGDFEPADANRVRRLIPLVAAA